MPSMTEINNEIIGGLEKKSVSIGDSVRVHVRIKEGAKSRIQVFEGTVIAKKHSGPAETFTVRKMSFGIGVERVFPAYSPNIDKVEIKSRHRVRRAKLYYLRDRTGKSARLKEIRS
ncbi:MAG: 50S ribosomal protein L19 [Myxococcota bacterium]|jgi:large subunit ribosomal protein L19